MAPPKLDDIHFMLNPQNKNAEGVAKWMSEKLANNTDPASSTPGAPPLFGNDAVPHLLTFQSIVGSFSRSYVNPDEAMRDSIENAHLMEKDVGLLESVECRQRLTALLDWEIVPEDEKCQYQVSLAQELQRIIGRIRNFTKYRMWLMKAIWSGRSGIQHKYGYSRVNGAMRLMPTPLHRDHNGWTPINGDKLVFRYEDGMSYTDEGAYPHQMGIKVGFNPGRQEMRIHRPYKLEPVSDGMALFLKQYERDTFCVHKHMIEDADFHHSYFAGSIHGVGIRSKIYWEWFLKQEAFAFLMQYLERSAGGVEVWTYPMGDPKALAATQKAAQEKMANGRNVVFFPKPMGDDSDMYKFDIIESGAMGLDIIQNIITDYFGGRLKRYILGQELSTEAKATGMGSGVAEAHMDTLSQIVNFDARNLEETLTHELVRYIQQLNFPETMGWHMRMSLKTEDDKTQERMEALNAAYQMGARISESEVFKTLGLSAPTSGEKILSMQSQQPAMPGMPGVMPPDAGIPDQENNPDQESEIGGDNPDGDSDPMELLRTLMDQYSMRTMQPDDTQERATLIAEILTGIYGDDVGSMLADKYSREFDPAKHPRHKAGRRDGGRFRPLLDDHEHAGVVSEVKSIVARGQRSPETVGRVAGILSRMSVAQLQAFKKEHGIKASGVKEELIQKIAQRLIMGGSGGNATPDTRPVDAKQKMLFDDSEPTTNPPIAGSVPQPVVATQPAQPPVTQSQQSPPTADVPSQPNAGMPVKPVRRRMMGGNADSMKAVAQPAAAPVAPKQPPAVTADGIQYIPSPIAAENGDVPVHVDLLKLDQAWSKDPAFHIGPDKKNAIGSRYDDAGEFMADPNNKVKMPEVSHDSRSGRVVVRDGRHRIASLRDSGKTSTWVTVPSEQAESFKSAFGKTDPPSVETVPEPTNQPAPSTTQNSSNTTETKKPNGYSQMQTDFISAFEKLDKADRGRNYLKLIDLRRELSGYSREEFNRGVLDLARSRAFGLEASEGSRVKLTPEEKDAGIMDGRELLVYVRRRDYGDDDNGDTEDATPTASQSFPSTTPSKKAASAQQQDVAPISAQVENTGGNDTERRNKLVTDNFKLVPQVVRMMQKKGWSVRDDDAAESAAMDGLMKAAEKWDGSTDFATYAKNGMAQAIKNLNRRKGDKMTVNASAGDDGEGNDLLSSVSARESDSGYGSDESDNLQKAISSLPNESDQWLVRAWFMKQDEDGNDLNQSEVAEQFNSRFGSSLTRQAVAARAMKLAASLRDSLKDPDQYAAVRNMIVRYYRNEILTMQKERYERRQDRVIRQAAEYTETDPTDAQIKAGNYKKGRFSWNGMQIVIENPRGSVRRGVSSSGEIWRREMTAHYGYISGTEGADGDQVDVFMGRHPESELVFVVHQIDQSTGEFDELKVVLGETNMKKAKELYLSNYTKGWKCGEIEPMTVAQFKELLESGGCC